MNLLRGEFLLTNSVGGDILLRFRSGKRPADVLATSIGFPKRRQAMCFIEECIVAGLIVTEPPAQATEDILASQDDSHLSGNSFSLTVELSTHCNLRCRHCYSRSGPDRMVRLAQTQIDCILRQAADLYPRLRSLTLTGGEPLMYPGLEHVILEGLNVGFEVVRINTNGTVQPGNKLLGTLREQSSRIDVQLTFLGATADTHDRLSSVNGSFRKMLGNIAPLTKTGCRVSASVIRWLGSVQELDAAVKLAESFGLPAVVGDVYPIGRGLDNKDAIIVPLELVSDVSAAGGTAGPALGTIPKDKWVSLLEEFPPELPCGRSCLAVSCNGDVLPCMLLQGVMIGNIVEKPLWRIVASEDMTGFYEAVSINNRKTCSECELRYVCGNKCPAVSLSFGGGLGSKSQFCTYYGNEERIHDPKWLGP